VGFSSWLLLLLLYHWGLLQSVTTLEADKRGGIASKYSAKEVFDTFNTNVFGTFNVARAAIPYLREAAQVPGQMAALVTFGSLGSWWSGAAVAHCEFLSTLHSLEIVSDVDCQQTAAPSSL
jgi:NAD(P)-dependent dehydrogenase (short-subunit alcohol dehydrogenase family)